MRDTGWGLCAGDEGGRVREGGRAEREAVSKCRGGWDGYRSEVGGGGHGLRRGENGGNEKQEGGYLVVVW